MKCFCIILLFSLVSVTPNYAQKLLRDTIVPLISNIYIHAPQGAFYHTQKEAISRIGNTNRMRRCNYNKLDITTKATSSTTEVYYDNNTQQWGKAYWTGTSSSEQKDSIAYEQLLDFALSKKTNNYTIEGKESYFNLGKWQGQYPYIDLYWEWDGIYYTDEVIVNEDEDGVRFKAFDIHYRLKRGKKHYHGQFIRYILLEDKIFTLTTSGVAKDEKTKPKYVFKTIKEEFDATQARLIRG